MNIRLYLICLLCQAHVLMAFVRLPSVSIETSGYNTCVCFDQVGMMWIGTSEGLVKNDGYKCTIYNSNITTPYLLPNDYVRCLTAADSSTLWIGTNDGLACMDLCTGKTRHYHLSRKTQRIVYTLFTASDGTVYAGTDGGLVRYIKGSDRWEDVPMCQFSVKCIAEDGHGNLFMGTWADGLRVRSCDGSRVWRVGEAGANVLALCFDKNGRLWTGSWYGGINVIDNPGNREKRTVRQVSGTDDRSIYQMKLDPRTNTIWACSRKSVVVIAPGKHIGEEQIQYLESDERSEYCSIDINSCGIVAVPSTWGDISTWSTKAPLQTFYAVDALCPITALFTDDDRHILAVSSKSGVCSMEVCERGVTTSRLWNTTDLRDEMPSSCYAVTRRANGDVWIGSYYSGAVILKKEGGITVWNTRNVPELSENGIASFCAEDDGAMWVGQWSSVVRVSPDNNVTAINLGKYVDNIYKSKVRHMTVDHLHQVWITTYSNGILRMNADFADAADVKVWQYDIANGRLPLREATACVEDKWGRVWAISMTGGLLRYDEHNDRFVSVGTQYGIYEDNIVGAAADVSGNLWMITANRIVCLCQNGQGPTNVMRFPFPSGGGMIKPQENSVFLSGKYMYFTSQNGFVRFSPSALLTSSESVMPPMAITDMCVDGRQLAELDTVQRTRLCGDILPPYTRSIVLPASVGKLSVSFASLSYDGNSGRHYSYCLEGYDKDRRMCAEGSAPEATYENLPEGLFTLHIWMTDNTGQWHEAPFTLSVEVLPPWWRTWWACILWMTAASGLGWMAVKWYQRHIRTLNKLRIANVFTNITHEFITPLSIISAVADLLKADIPDTSYSSIQTNIERLKRLIRQILEVEKEADEQLRIVVSKDNLGRFICDMCDNMKVLAGQKNITVECHVQDAFAEAYFDSDKLDTILYNLLSNAIKYTEEGGTVVVSLQKAENGYALITVADTGIGIDKKRMKHLYSRFMDGDYRRMKTMGTGIGLSLTRDLVLLHHGTIRCESEQGNGTSFIIELPTDGGAYSNEMESVPVTKDKNVTKNHDGAEANTTSSTTTNDTAPIILLVEDNANLLSLMQQFLSKYYTVLTAKNGQQALNIIGRKPLDIVITDVMMPVMDGVELTKCIKNNPDTAQLPVVILTAKTGKEDRNDAYRMGADEYLTKPFGMDDLQLRINSILANRERIRLQFMRQTEFQVERQAYSDPDAVFIKKAIECVKRHLADSDYDREGFARDMCMSTSTLYKKLRALTGQNVSAFVNSIRLKEACSIARTEPDVQVSELYVRLGYNSPSYFARLFKAEFGLTFTEYKEKYNESAIQDAQE